MEVNKNGVAIRVDPVAVVTLAAAHVAIAQLLDLLDCITFIHEGHRNNCYKDGVNLDGHFGTVIEDAVRTASGIDSVMSVVDKRDVNAGTALFLAATALKKEGKL